MEPIASKGTLSRSPYAKAGDGSGLVCKRTEEGRFLLQNIDSTSGCASNSLIQALACVVGGFGRNYRLAHYDPTAVTQYKTVCGHNGGAIQMTGDGLPEGVA